MTNKLVVIINSLKYQKLRKCYYIKWNFLYQITAASRTPDYGATAPRSPSSLSSVLNWIYWTPPPTRKKIPGYATAAFRPSPPDGHGCHLRYKSQPAALSNSRQMFCAFWPYPRSPFPSPTAQQPIVPISWCTQSSDTWKLFTASCPSSLMRSDYKTIATCMSARPGWGSSLYSSNSSTSLCRNQYSPELPLLLARSSFHIR